MTTFFSTKLANKSSLVSLVASVAALLVDSVANVQVPQDARSCNSKSGCPRFESDTVSRPRTCAADSCCLLMTQVLIIPQVPPN